MHPHIRTALGLLVLFLGVVGLAQAQSGSGDKVLPTKTPIPSATAQPDLREKVFVVKEQTGQPIPFPTDGQGWLTLSESEFFALFQQPNAFNEFVAVGLPAVLEDVRAELGEQFTVYTQQAQAAYETDLARIVLVVVGGLLLTFPHRLHILTWLLVGAVAGVLFVQTDAAQDALRSIAPDEPELRAGVVGLVVAFAFGTLFISTVSGLIFFVGSTLAGFLAGGLIGAQLFNDSILDLGQPTVLIPAIVFSVLMGYAVGRGSRLVAIVVGGLMVVLGLRWGVGLVLPIALVSFVAMMLRTQWRRAFKREPLNQLNLREGEVRLEGQNRPTQSGRKSQIISDDSDNSPIGRFP